MTTIPPVADDEAMRIAGTLTKAQRAAIANAGRSWDCDRDRVWGSGMTRKALRERGLGHGDYCYLTPLGLRVRAALQNGGAGDGATSPASRERE